MSHPYERLSPDLILDAIESAGFWPDGSLLALNSYENRVMQVGIEDSEPLVAKFYRPERWSDEAILEDHGFSLALAANEIPVVPPLTDKNGGSLFSHQGFRFALFPRQGGRAPELENLDNLEWIGRFLARIHQLGAAREFQYRERIDVTQMGQRSVDYLLQSGMLPTEVEGRYASLCSRLLEQVSAVFAAVDTRWIRLHGDCHPGNILWTEQGPHFVDMDDCRMGPAIQDLWMLLSGDRQEMTLQLNTLLEGYRMFRDFDSRELACIEPLRTLRLIHYTAWLARRWEDPAFPLAFPWFNTQAYWQEHLAILEEQENALAQPPLRCYG